MEVGELPWTGRAARVGLASAAAATHLVLMEQIIVIFFIIIKVNHRQ